MNLLNEGQQFTQINPLPLMRVLSQLRGVSVCFMRRNQTPIVTPNSVNTIVTLDAAATRGMRQNDHAKPTAGVAGRLSEAFGKTCRPEYFN